MPVSFKSILGQDATIERLQGAYRTDRLPHGLIFFGPAGVGKATTAKALGALFLCERPGADDACGQCDSCMAVRTNAHPDFHVIHKELIRFHDKTGKSKGIDLSIQVIRPELLEKASRKAVLGRGKVFVIEQADYMNAQAQSAMLKTLEEPEGRTLIILLTDALESLLQTIRSRCQAFSFASLELKTVYRELINRGIAKPQAEAATRLSEGSLGDAIKWLEDGVVDVVGGLFERLNTVLNGEPVTDLGDWFKKAAEAYANKQLERDELTSKDQATRAGLALYLKIAAQQFRSRLRDDNSTNYDAMENACNAIEAIQRAEMLLDTNVNMSLVFHQLSMTLARLYRSTALDRS